MGVIAAKFKVLCAALLKIDRWPDDIYKAIDVEEYFFEWQFTNGHILRITFDGDNKFHFMRTYPSVTNIKAKFMSMTSDELEQWLEELRVLVDHMGG